MVRVAESGMVCNKCTRGPLQNTLVEPFDSKVMGYVAGWRWEKKFRRCHLNNFPKGFAQN